MWDAWFHGNRETRISPCRRFKAGDMPSETQKTILSKMRKVVSAITDEAVLISAITLPGALSQMSPDETDKVFGEAYPSLCMKLYELPVLEDFDHRRLGDLSVITMYDRIQKWKRT